MKMPFYDLMIELDIEGIVEIEDLELKEDLNCHSTVKIKCLIEDSYAWQAVLSSSGLTVKLYFKDTVIFYGYLTSVKSYEERGSFFVDMLFSSKTQDMDINKRNRAFYQMNDSYINVVNKVLQMYSGIQVKDEITNNKQIPSILLEYEETDWEFLIRLASHFSSFIVPDAASESAKFYFGIPEFDNQTEFHNSDYTIVQDMDCYYKRNNNLKQEYICWKIISKKYLKIGEKVTFNEVPVIVTSVHIYESQGELIREYTLHRKEGLASEYKINMEIMGLSLPATVTNRQRNMVTVDFDINASYPPEQPSRYFLYAIEVSSFYCMPEIGSRVHIYFPDRLEANAIAVHALSTDSGSSKTPSDKTFSSPYGSAMQLTPTCYQFMSDSTGASVLNLGADGNISFLGGNVTIEAENLISIGEGEKGNTPEIVSTAETEQKIQADEGASSICLNADNTILSDKITIKAESGDMSAEAAEIKEETEKSDEQLRDNYNNQDTKQTPSGDKNAPPNDNKDTTSKDVGDMAMEEDDEEDTEKDSNFEFKFLPGNTTIPTKFDKELDIPKEDLELGKQHTNATSSDPYKEVEDHRGDFHGTEILSLEDSIAVYDEEIKGEKGKLEVSAFKAYYGISGFAGYSEFDEDGNKRKRYGLGGAAQLGASMLDMEGTLRAFGVDNEVFNINAGGSVSLAKAEASIDGEITFGSDGVNIGAGGEAGIYLVEGDINGGLTVAGVDATVKATGKIGFGIEGEVGYRDGKFKFRVGAACLIGGSVEFELDFEDVGKFGQQVADWWNDLW